MSNQKQFSTIMKKHFYFLSLLLGLAISMTGFTSCGDDDDTPQQQPQVVTPSLNLDFASIDPQFVVNGEDGEQYVQLTAGESLDIPFKVEPAELASQIVLTSSDPSIVVVEGLKLNALKAGRVTITAKAGELEKSFVVEVKKFVDRDENGNLKISEINFPDENFRKFVKDNFDKNSDGVLTDAEIAEVTSISVNSSDIKTLEGIDFFTALQSLECSSNQLTSLDLSKNTALKYLYCGNNQITSLDVSKNTALTELDCHKNQLTSLDVTKNTALTYLDCSSNQITSLDLSKNTNMKGLYCHSNKLTSLDVTKNTALEYLACDDNQLTSLDLSKNSALKQLYCDNNQITSLDLSNNPKMSSSSLVCDDNVEVIWGKK